MRLNKEEGATALKDYAQFNRMTRQALYAAARRQGVNVVAETAVDPQMNWTMLIDGVSGLEHTVGLTPLYDDVIRLWGATGAGNTPTLIVVYNGPAGEQYFHQRDRLWEDKKLLRFFNRDDLLAFRRTTRYYDDDVYAGDMAAELRKLHKAGVSLQVSGHGQMHGLDKHWEMELMGRGGFTPAEILGFATIQSARYLNLDSQLGSIEAGKFADLVIMSANPLDDIKNTRTIELVMQNGVLYSGNDASRVWPNPAPAPEAVLHAVATGYWLLATGYWQQLPAASCQRRRQRTTHACPIASRLSALAVLCAVYAATPLRPAAAQEGAQGITPRPAPRREAHHPERSRARGQRHAHDRAVRHRAREREHRGHGAARSGRGAHGKRQASRGLGRDRCQRQVRAAGADQHPRAHPG